MSRTERAPWIALAAAFAAVYLIWGSTYLAIRFVVEDLPPLVSAGARFVVAGAFLYAVMRGRGVAAPTRAHWKGATIVGGFLLLGGNGIVMIVEQTVPSGLTALVIALVPVWMVLFQWWAPDGSRPRKTVFAGLALGGAGMLVLVGPTAVLGEGQVWPPGALMLVAATGLWAWGSVYSRRAGLPASPLMATALEMLGGGALLLAVGTLLGEWGDLDLAGVGPRAWWSLGYLVVFGSLVAFTAYVYLLKATTPARASTYAYVNPLVAVVLGWAFADEPLSWRVALAAALILGAVAMVAVGPRPAAPDEATDGSASRA